MGEGLGGNSGNNGKATLGDRLNFINIGRLFTDGSPHSEHICQQYINDKGDGVRCGYK
ncbi:hypothetical protein CCAL12920_03255 [Campylobacter sp. RM12920]|uniref:Uncharacterized protein n=1 Tax=Campylobacter californiensis TaxID=1032243 RepID=A0ABD4JG99_9BACT|nr:hypothetical protein [Campylobacter sp. RM12919]MBE2987916.1 hypothetical protein [Campylobacter sp. RM12920]